MKLYKPNLKSRKLDFIMIMMYFLFYYVIAETLNDDILGQVVTVQATDKGLRNIYMDDKNRLSLIKSSDIRNKEIEIKFIREHKNHYVIEMNGKKICYVAEGVEIKACDNQEKSAKNMLWKVLPLEEKNMFRIYSEIVRRSRNGRTRRFCMTPRGDKIVTEECKKSDKSQIFKIKKTLGLRDVDSDEEVETNSSDNECKEKNNKKRQTLSEKALAALEDPNYDLSEYEISIPEEYEIVGCSNDNEESNQNIDKVCEPKNMPRPALPQTSQSPAQGNNNQYPIGYSSFYNIPMQFPYQYNQPVYPQQPFQYNYVPQQQGYPMAPNQNPQPNYNMQNQNQMCQTTTSSIPGQTQSAENNQPTVSSCVLQTGLQQSGTQQKMHRVPQNRIKTSGLNDVLDNANNLADLSFESIVISDEISRLPQSTGSSQRKTRPTYNPKDVLKTNQVLYHSKYTTILSIPTQEASSTNNIYTVLLLNTTLGTQNQTFATTTLQPESETQAIQASCTQAIQTGSSSLLPQVVDQGGQALTQTFTQTGSNIFDTPSKLESSQKNSESIPVTMKPQLLPSTCSLSDSNGVGSPISQSMGMAKGEDQALLPNEPLNSPSDSICTSVLKNNLQDGTSLNETGNNALTKEADIGPEYNVYTDQANQILGNHDETLVECLANAPSELPSIENNQNSEKTNNAELNDTSKSSQAPLLVDEENFMNMLNEYTKECVRPKVNPPDLEDSPPAEDSSNNKESFDPTVYPTKVGGMHLEYTESEKSNGGECETKKEAYNDDFDIDKHSVYIGQAQTPGGTVTIYKDPNGVFFLRGNLPDCRNNSYRIVCNK